MIKITRKFIWGKGEYKEKKSKKKKADQKKKKKKI